jgi:hypothetical protein
MTHGPIEYGGTLADRDEETNAAPQRGDAIPCACLAYGRQCWIPRD